MNSRDLTLACINGETDKVDRIPFNPFIMHLAATVIDVDYSARYCQDPSLLAKGQVKCTKIFGIDHVNVSTDAYREASAWGMSIDFSVHTPMPFKAQHLDWRTFNELESPEIAAAPRMMQRVESIMQLKEKAPESCIFGWIEAPFAELISLFGMMEVVRIMNQDGGMERLHEMIDRILPVQRDFAMVQVEAGADVIGAGDSSISQFGPRWFRDVSLDATRLLFSDIKKHVPVVYHVCGDNSGVVGDGGEENDMLKLIASTGADVIDVDMQVDLTVARKKFGPGICLRGNTDTTVLGDAGISVERVVDAIERTIEVGKPGRRFMYAAGCEWPWAPRDLATRNLGIANAILTKLGRY